MDVQGSRFHLLHGLADWGGCIDATSGLTLADLWADALDAIPSSVPTSWEFDPAQGVLRLRRDTPLFRRAGRTDPLDVQTRRGSGRDGFGTWYWVDADRRTIRRRPRDDRTASLWWSVDELTATCTCAGTPGSTFADATGCAHAGITLQGLAVTTRHYLLAGYTSNAPGLEAGLLVFDLQAGGAPLRLVWPAESDFEPWDLADTADGGALVLDRRQASYWRLDEHLRLRGTQASRAALFGPVDGSPPIQVTDEARPVPQLLHDAGGTPLHAISIEPGPGGSVLVLDQDPARGYSVLSCFDGDVLRWQNPMIDVVEVIDPKDPTSIPFRYSLTGHDFCYLEGTGGPLAPPMLYVADAEGDQVVAFDLDPETGALLPRDDFLPLRRWAGRALARQPGGAYYDFGERWIALQVFSECRFASEATLTTPLSFGLEAGLSGTLLDSQRPGCVWHRLLLDAHLPTGTSIAVRARASDDATLLPLEQWLPQPVPYLRSDGPELPWNDPWADRRVDGALPDGMGTHELLFQNVQGRFVQLEITLAGGGRSTPLLRSARAWFPRFSYPEHYLPAVYAENDTPDRFLERFLANFEGTYTAIEERIEHSHLLLDSRTSLAGDLPWLAAWFGLALDPLWDERRRRFLVRHVDTFYRLRGTVAGLVATLRVYLDGEADERVFRTSAGGGAAGGVRIVERFLTRDTGGAAYGAPASTPDPDPATRVRQAAHRFDVLVPLGLSEDDTAMVRRIVRTASPAHTAFNLRRYDELFVVGQARLGLDTELGHGPSFQPMVTGRDPLASGYLGYPFPFNIADRVVGDRDRLGALPPL